MKFKHSYFLSIFTLFFGFSVQSQQLWDELKSLEYIPKSKPLYEKDNFPKSYKVVTFEFDFFKKSIAQQKSTSQQIIELPDATGQLKRFTIRETSNFDAELQRKFPEIQSFTAQGIDDATSVAKISIGTDGFHAVIFSGKQETVYIDPYTKDNKSYLVYKRSSLSPEEEDFKCMVEETSSKTAFSTLEFAKNPNDGKLRTYRLALVCSGEYADFHLGPNQQNIPSTATDQVKKAAILSAMNTSMTRVNGVFEKDLAVKMVLVSNNDQLIFLDKNTDGITDGNPNTMINEVQTKCDNIIGNANYDIGHIFSVGGDGLAGLGVVCISGQKARGVTGRASPVGDAYDIDFVIHEMGHQFGANHTQNNNCNRNNSTAIEPGSASTIMGYAGICAPNVQNQSDDYFHAVSIAEMWNIIITSGTCAAITNTNNAAPTANAGADYSIPASTPFKLTGIATDANGLQSLTYNWEQLDKESATMPPIETNAVGPMFRSLPSKTTPTRFFPDITTVIAGNGSIGSTWERIPSVARELNFSFTVRDNNAGGASLARDDVKVTVVNASPFAVTSQSSFVSYDTGTTQTVTWTVGNTNAAPINCQNVNIKLSIDGGLTFPITLKSTTSNDGSETIVIPDNSTRSARIMVEAADNIFYQINPINFEIKSTTPTFVLTDTSGVQSVCNIGNLTASFVLNFDFVNGFTETATLSATGLPSGSVANFSPNTINSDGNVTLTISNLNGVSAQDYTISVQATSASITKNVDVTLKVTSSEFGKMILVSPQNNAVNAILSQQLQWNLDANATSYDVQIASDINFSTIVSSGNVTTNSYTSTNLSGNTTYYWRIKPKNDCGEGNFSNPFSFTTLIPSYCASTFTDEVGGKEYISNVTFNTINNNSGNNTTGGYENFTAISTNVKRGDSHPISVTLDPDGYQDHVFVFIDWNQDFVFDNATERYSLGTIIGLIGTATGSITVPNDARFGSTRMRVIIEYDDPDDGFGEGACDADHLTEWGETEDYTVIVDNTASIEDVVFSNFNLFPNPTKGTFKVQFDADDSQKVSVQLYDITGRFIGEKNYQNSSLYFSENINFDNLSSGMYLVKVKNGTKQTTRKLMVE
jgi:trimeric autotransporter adhesin